MLRVLYKLPEETPSPQLPMERSPATRDRAASSHGSTPAANHREASPAAAAPGGSAAAAAVSSSSLPPSASLAALASLAVVGTAPPEIMELDQKDPSPQPSIVAPSMVPAAAANAASSPAASNQPQEDELKRVLLDYLSRHSETYRLHRAVGTLHDSIAQVSSLRSVSEVLAPEVSNSSPDLLLRDIRLAIDRYNGHRPRLNPDTCMLLSLLNADLVKPLQPWMPK